MDFASLMSQQISKSDPKASSASTESTAKYLKRADIEAQRQEAYIKEQQALQRERELKLQKKRKLDEEEAIRAEQRDQKRNRLAEESRLRREAEEEKKERARRSRLGLPDLPPKDQLTPGGTLLPQSEKDILDEDLIPKLRALNEPIILFGETHKQRLRRYKRLTAPESLSPPQSSGPIPTTLTLVPEASMKVPPSVPSDPEGRNFLFRQLASYFTMVLTEWALALNQRETSVKESSQGKAAYSAMVQSRENMRPLFKKFEKGELEDGILEPVVEIVRASQERRYVDANDGYLRLSIGKA